MESKSTNDYLRSNSIRITTSTSHGANVEDVDQNFFEHCGEKVGLCYRPPTKALGADAHV